ncbi:LuxR C-terminal-related transcriptional regulator [Kitasatospora sp. NPDC002227]|uniref:helix-turn-helix transcriptional regulator n=1 Tax=Kitasatospora sp. NPDC002227 TaxID=3154773 RepID=UPI003322D178
MTVRGATWEPRLRKLLSAAATGDPALILVEGRAGTGKTHLVQWLFDLPQSRSGSRLVVSFSAAGAPYVRGLSHPARPGPSRAGPTAAPGKAGTPAGRPARPGAGHPGWSELGDLAAELESLIGTGEPLLLVAEDVHRADEAARGLLCGLLERPPGRLAVVLSYRPEELAVPGLVLGAAVAYPPQLSVLRVRLDPLGMDEVQRLAAGALGESRCPAEFVTRLHERSGGVAQVVNDLLRELSDADGSGGRPRHTSRDVDAQAVPVRLGELMLSRTAALPEQHRPVVWAAAVLDEPAGAAELAAVAGLSEGGGRAALLAALDRAALDELGTDRYGFRVPLAAAAVYEPLPGPVRQDLHRRAAEALARRQPVPWTRLAHHQSRCGQVPAWLDSVETAARQAADAGEHQNAIALLEDALGHPSVPKPTRAQLALLLARNAVVGLRSDQTVAVLRRIVDDSSLPAEVRGEIRLDLGLLLGNQVGRGAEGREELERAAEELDDRPTLAARAMSGLAMPYWPGGSLAENLAWLERAEAAAAESEDAPVRAAVAANRVAVLMNAGDPAAWQLVEQLPVDSPDLACRQHAARGLCNAADAAAWLGEYKRAAELLAEGIDLAARSGQSYAERTGRSTVLLLDWAAGRWEGLAGRARELVSEAGEMPLIAADAHLVLGLLALAKGEWAEVGTWVSGTSTPARDDGAVPLVAAASGVRIRLALARTDLDAAAQEAAEAWRRLRAKGVWVWGAELAPWAVEAMARTRRPDAVEMVAEFAAGLVGRDAPMATAALARCRGSLAETGGEPGAAARHYREAVAGYEALPRPYETALARERAGLCALAESAAVTGESALADGLDELREAARRLEDLGAVWDATRVRAALRVHDTSAERRPPGRPGYGELLSPREREVAVLAGSGLTNRDIAATLHLSPRTVEQHVARSLRKLGVQSRQELAKAGLEEAQPPTAG